MAITGTKAFTSGEVLTANDVNQYLMRGVKVFSSTAVRDAAYGGAGEPVLEEGETCYITATDELQTYNGSSWVKMGPTSLKISQVVQTVKTDTFSTSSTSFVDITGLTVAITPVATSSKVLVMGQVAFSNPGGSGTLHLRLNGGNSSNFVGDAAGSRVRGLQSNLDGVNWSMPTGSLVSTFVYLDSPNTTSATTYAIQMRMVSTTGFINRTTTDTDNTSYGRFASSITAMEVLA